MPIDSFKEAVIKAAPFTVLWALWGIVAQLNWTRKGEPFKLGMLIINIIISAYVWTFVGTSLPETMGDLRFGIASTAWVLAFPIIDFIEKKWLKLLIKRFLWDNV